MKLASILASLSFVSLSCMSQPESSIAPGNDPSLPIEDVAATPASAPAFATTPAPAEMSVATKRFRFNTALTLRFLGAEVPAYDPLGAQPEFFGVVIPEQLRDFVDDIQSSTRALPVEGDALLLDPHTTPLVKRQWISALASRMTVGDGEDMRLSADLFDSVSSTGGPPWHTPRLGGSMLVEFKDSAGVWQKYQDATWKDSAGAMHPCKVQYCVEFDAEQVGP